MTESGPEFVSVREFTGRTSLSIRTVERLLERGEIPSIRVGRRRLIPLNSAIKALERISDASGSQSDGGWHSGSAI